MENLQFEMFPKMGRLSRDVLITEKIDGSNGQIVIAPMSLLPVDLGKFIIALKPDGSDVMLAGSRTRYITPEDDNFGFARWVKEHAEELWALGEGRHFGEWWGQKIQRGYDLTEKRFSLFNVQRWCGQADEPKEIPTGDPRVTHLQVRAPACCSVVPTLYEGLFQTMKVDGVIERLRHEGSLAAPGYMNAEGVVVYHKACGTLFKKTLEKDEAPKGKTS